jgi:hypothetical protein
MSAGKWVTAQHLNIILNPDVPGSGAGLRPFEPVRVGARVHISRLPNGTQSGFTAAILQIDLDDGSTVCLEMTLRLLASAVDALRAVDKAEGGPGWTDGR